MTIITNGLPSAAPKPLGACNIIVANMFLPDFLPFFCFAAHLAEDSNSLPRVLARFHKPYALSSGGAVRTARAPSDSELRRVNLRRVQPAACSGRALRVACVHRR
jgi:hypothetical protein